jgi:hypothetical protein
VGEKAGSVGFPAVDGQGCGEGEILALFGDNSGQNVWDGAGQRCDFHGSKVAGDDDRRVGAKILSEVKWFRVSGLRTVRRNG